MDSLLDIQNLTVEYTHGKTYTAAVKNVSLSLHSSETLAVVGESGSGKSTLALSIIGLLPKRESRIPSGQILFKQTNLLNQEPERLRRIRGKSIAMIFQDPFSSLNPVMTVRAQIEETLRLDSPNPDPGRPAALLREVQLSETDRLLKSYPHQLSGGQRQRVMIAMALARSPELLIADEPTTALDVLVQDEILKLLKKIQAAHHMGLMFITHNLGLVKILSDRTAVMYQGQIVEEGPSSQVLYKPEHPYTRGLVNCLPSLKASHDPLPVWEGEAPRP